MMRCGENGGIRKQCGKCAVFFAAVMVFAEFSAALPLQARETVNAEFTPYAQIESVSGNDTASDPEPEELPEDTAQTPGQEESSEDMQQTSRQEESPKNTTQDTEQGDSGNTTTPPTITSEPEDVRVEAGGYASFNVSATGKELTYQWLVDRGDGSGFQEIAGADRELYQVMVFDGSMNGYMYKCKVKSGEKDEEDSSDNCVKSRAAKLTIYYSIVGGAQSVWVRSSGRGLVFQGSGAYAKLNGVSVDGSRITAGEYNKGGSQTPFTEITLLRSYLETLAEGDHEVEIVWSDGAARTSFRIEPPATNLPADSSGLGRADGDAAGSSRAAGTTAAAAGVTDARQTEKKAAADRTEKEKTGAGGVSDNTLDESLSENMVKPSAGKTTDVLPSAGISAGMLGEEMTVIHGRRRMERTSSDFEKSPVEFAEMSEAVNRYAQKICMALILISAAGIASGLLAYRLHDVEGKKNE